MQQELDAIAPILEGAERYKQHTGLREAQSLVTAFSGLPTPSPMTELKKRSRQRQLEEEAEENEINRVQAMEFNIPERLKRIRNYWREGKVQPHYRPSRVGGPPILSGWRVSTNVDVLVCNLLEPDYGPSVKPGVLTSLAIYPMTTAIIVTSGMEQIRNVNLLYREPDNPNPQPTLAESLQRDGYVAFWDASIARQKLEYRQAEVVGKPETQLVTNFNPCQDDVNDAFDFVLAQALWVRKHWASSPAQMRDHFQQIFAQIPPLKNDRTIYAPEIRQVYRHHVPETAWQQIRHLFSFGGESSRIPLR